MNTTSTLLNEPSQPWKQWQTPGCLPVTGSPWGSACLNACSLPGGLWMMNKSNASRDAQNALQQQRHAETMTVQQRRHEESMAAQQQRHEENMAVQQQRHEEAMTAQQQQHEESILALKELIRRTAGKDA